MSYKIYWKYHVKYTKSLKVIHVWRQDYSGMVGAMWTIETLGM